MKLKKINNFVVGCNIKCIQPSWGLTFNKEYKVLDIYDIDNDVFFNIINDFKDVQAYYIRRFKRIISLEDKIRFVKELL